MERILAQSQKGFTFIELAIVLGIISILIGFTSLSLFNIRSQTSLNSTIEMFVSDIKQQQTKAMEGNTEGGARASGLYIGTTSYTLFQGDTYSASDPHNFIFSLAKGEEISTTFPNQTILFDPVSGEIQGFSEGENTVTFKSNANNSQKIVTINRYGALVSVQ